MTSTARADRPAVDLRRAVLPAAILLAVLAIVGVLQLVFDPFRQDIPLCLLHRLTGLHCPGCGATRAVHALLQGDPLLALRNNALIVLSLPVVAVVFVRGAIRRVRGLPGLALPSTRTVLIVVGIAMAFAVARNIPFFWFIAPTTAVGV